MVEEGAIALLVEVTEAKGRTLASGLGGAS